MQLTLSKWGNSLGIRIPSFISKQLNLNENEVVDLTIEDDHILIQKVYQLDSLLKQITPQNLHTEIKTDDIQGKEIW